MAIQSRRGNISNFDKSKMLPGEWGIALDSQEAFVCFGAGITKKMATYEDYQDMIDDCVEVTQTAQGVVDSFNSLEIEKLAIDDTSVSLITGWSSDKITKYDTKDNVVTFTEATTRENIATGEKHSVIFGKIKKFFADLKTVAFTGKYNDLTNVAIENPTTLPTASADTLGKIYRDGTGLKITLRSGIEGSYTYSWVPFISRDKVVNNFVTTEDGFVADARGLKTLKDGLDSVNNNLDYKINAFSYVNGTYGKLISGYNYKTGKEMQINAGYIIESEIPSGTAFKLFTVNTKNVPLANIQTNITVAGRNYLLYALLDINGDITVTNLSGAAIPISTTLCLSLRYLTNYYEVS